LIIPPAGRANLEAPAATLDTRYSFTLQFLQGAAIQARRAAEIEARDPKTITEDDQVVHRGLVIGAIMQSVAALECEIWEVMRHGPGHQRGSNGIDARAKAFLEPLVDLFADQPTLDRYRLVLHALKRRPFDAGAQPWQDANTVIRNELVHYKSKWGQELSRSKFLRCLEEKLHAKAPFIHESTNFFPLRCLNAACAAWTVAVCFDFLHGFYQRLDAPNALDGWRSKLLKHIQLEP
jgi:hypothetical protein